MTEVLWPLDLCPSSQTWNIIGNAATFTSPLSGATRTYGRPGARLGCTMTFPMMRGQDRARLVAFINTLLDRSNRAWVPDFSTTRRGSFSVSELLTNNDFSNGTTGWTATRCTLTAADRVLRLTNTKSGGANNFSVSQSSLSVTQYAPYVLRSMISALSRSGMSNGTVLGTSNYATDRDGLVAQLAVSSAATFGSAAPGVFDANGTVSLAGDYAELSWTSLARCIQVDGGGNLLTYSDQIDNAAWTASAVTITANAGTAADGTANADRLLETTANSLHFVQRTSNLTINSAAADYSVTVVVERINRGHCFLQVEESGGTTIYQVFDILNGAVGTGTSGPSANLTNLRSHICDLGNAKYAVTLTFSKVNAATGINIIVGPSSGDNRSAYAGNTSNGIYVWRATVTQSSVPSRLTQAVATAVSASTQTGTGIYVKGLPASTQGLLEAGDPVQIGGQINFLTARLNSDAAGRGYLQCGRPWLAATNDAPVIVHQPMCKMILATDTLDLDTGPGQFSPFQIELVEAIE